MKIISIEAEGIDGNLELREPTVREVMPLLAMIKKGGDEVFADLLDRVVFLDGERLTDASEKIGSSEMMDLMPKVYEIIGVSDDDGGND